MSTSGHLLLISSNPGSSSFLLKHLRILGYSVTVVTNIEDALQYIRSQLPILVLIAGSLSLELSLELCRKLRSENRHIPLLLLCKSNHYSVRVAALNAGVDDVLSQPFALEELIARLRALLRRSCTRVNDTTQTELCHRDLSLNRKTRQVHRAGNLIRLTVKEYDLLLYLLQNKECVASRQEILKAVWGDSWVGDDNLLDVYMRYLRKKIESSGLEPLIHTVRGVGFVLR